MKTILGCAVLVVVLVIAWIDSMLNRVRYLRP